MQRLTLHAKDKNYDIIFGQGILKDISALFDFKGRKVCVITDSNVAPLYLDGVKRDLCTEYSFIFKAGEASKNLSICLEIYNYLASCGFTKTDCLLALGGGVTGDMTGFVASTYLRGIKYYSVPTTLLAQVDSSVGGKCGVDIEGGKNLVGSFYQPCGVLIDTGVLKKLSPSVFADGMAEVIKYGFIYDSNLYEMCMQNLEEKLSDIIFRCVDIKREVVECDEFDEGLRMILNFGHTIGHAIEKLGNYRLYTHGQAVAIGMAYAAKISESAGTAKKGLYEKVKDALIKLNLPVKSDFTLDEMLPVLLGDKKMRGGKLNFILLTDIGSSVIYKVDSGSVRDFLLPAFEV